MEKLREGFVKHEYGIGLAQSDVGCKTPEEINLVRKIESRTQSLSQSLNTIEELTNGLNKSLLPLRSKTESEAKVDERPPQGWLEIHLRNLDLALYRSGQIYEQVTRLRQATKTEVKQVI